MGKREEMQRRGLVFMLKNHWHNSVILTSNEGYFRPINRIYARAVYIQRLAFESGGTMVVGPSDELAF